MVEKRRSGVPFFVVFSIEPVSASSQIGHLEESTSEPKIIIIIMI